MNQHVNDRTEQHSSSVRSRRATAVREVSQNEHEEVSTRIVANYNHMHALTVQYYEVVQIYRVTVRLKQFVRALFLPFELLDFSTADASDLVARFRGLLLNAALTRRAAELLIDDRGKVEVRSGIRVPIAINIDALTGTEVVSGGALAGAATRMSTTGAATRRLAIDGANNGESTTSGSTTGGTTTGGSTSGGTPDPTAPTTRPTTRFTVVRAGPIEEVLPGDARLVSISFVDVGISRVQVDRAGTTAALSTFPVPSSTSQVDFTNEILLRAVEGIRVARNEGTRAEGSMLLRYESDGHESIAEVPLSLGDGTNMQKVAFFSADAADRRAELLAHLQANRAYYTRAILENLDSASLVMLLSGASWQDKPLVDQVEPNPIAVTGNYLVLRAPAEDEDPAGLDGDTTWGTLLTERGVSFDDQDMRLVPIPTGGVFAEAVLGRSNSAERLDITRFWNWQDSPIPIQPPEIAPVGVGSRATEEGLTPGTLGAPVINLMPPASLPEPAGLTAALGALANGSMFRDMSGLAGTQAAAQAASAGTLTAATEAGRIASENYRTATNQATEMGKAAADMWKVLNSGGGGGSGSKSSAGISGDGARINQGRDLDRRNLSGPGAGPSSQKPRVSEFRPEFAGSRSEAPRQIASREVSYSDESAAVSPDLLGETVGALGGGPNGAPDVGLLGSPGDAASAGLNAAADVPITPYEARTLDEIRAWGEIFGLPLQGVELIPMRRHRNAAHFEGIELGAWTNSSTHIYVNLKLFQQRRKELEEGPEWASEWPPVSSDQALKDVLAIYVVVIRHEIQHVGQFRQNQDNPPDTFEEMIRFEAEAYPKDVAWLKDTQNADRLINVLGAEKRLLDRLAAVFASSAAAFAELKTSVTGEDIMAEDARLHGLKEGEFLPPMVFEAGTGSKLEYYSIVDLYTTPYYGIADLSP
jgi:hypothetical protein